MPNDSESQVPPPRPPLRLRYLFTALAALFGLPILIWLVWGWIESARLDRALDALEARHEPLDIAEFDVKPATPEQREASHLYARARKLVADLPITGQQSEALGSAIEQCDSDNGPRSGIPSLRAFEDRYAPVFELLDRASTLDAMGWDDADRPQPNSLEGMQTIALARANVVRIARRACAGEPEAAGSALWSTLRLRRVGLPGPVPMQTAHSLRVVLTAGSLPPALLERLQAEFAPMSDDRVFENWMLRQRASWLSYTMPGVFGEEPPGLGPRRITPLEAIVMRLVRPLRDHQAIAELREFDEALQIAKQPWPQTMEAVRTFASRHRANRSLSVRPGMIEALTRPFGAHAAGNRMTTYIAPIAEALARARASIGVIAVARYQHDHHRQLPATLRQLTPAYFDAPLVDPYTGTELRYWHDACGFKVYSVGINQKDDGGVWEQRSDLQQSRRGYPLDIGVEIGMWPRSCP